MAENKAYLFSIDLEDIRYRMTDGTQYKERVPDTIHQYLNWLNKHHFKCTFFTVGDIARAYPSLIKEIVNEGHEIACHTNTHIALDKLTKDSFKKDLEQNMESLFKAGADAIDGFRAPYFSLIKKSEHAYEVMKELGIRYSSSVYPAKNPFYGWPEFGNHIRTLDNGIVEIPMTVKNVGPLRVAYGGGVYFRVLPRFLIDYCFKMDSKKEEPIRGYFHPYDIDVDQEKFMHPEINDSKLYNWLMRYNRDNVFVRLDKVIKKNNLHVMTYHDYVTANLK